MSTLHPSLTLSLVIQPHVNSGTVVAGHNEQILNVILHKSRVDCAVSFDVNRSLLSRCPLVLR